ncbi:MAG TPA: 3-carboxy-cis,cis-muconate cycloisomerase [Candidatus Sulfotelmatobacter sp.]|nr:3-carboxy-cis,cis-muconate cycloisomerase [Candidatus Sulfotelmatobacter sp.]
MIADSAEFFRQMTLYDNLFSYGAMQDVLSDEARVHGMVRFEAALATAEARASIIPEGAARKIAEQCGSAQFDLRVIAKEAALAGNLAIPLIKMLTEAVARQDKDAARFVHWGATSQDAIDTGFVLQSRDALELVEKDLTQLSSTLAELARVHRKTVMVARTWMQQALPTTFGFVVAGWLDAILRQHTRLQEVKPRALALQFGGAVGTLAALRGDGPKVAKFLAEELHLTLPTAPWHVHRDRIAEVAGFCGVLTGILAKIARDISLQAQTEIAELAEPGGEGRGGSSTLPHKRNPVTCSIVLAAATRVPGLVSTVLAAMPQEGQRALGGWQAEWETLPEILRLSGGALHHLAEMMPQLQVDPQRMLQNMNATGGLIFAEAVSMALADRMGKMPAHLLVAAACKKAMAEHRPLQEVLREEPGLHGHLTTADLEGLFDARNYLGGAEEFVERITAQAKEFTRVNLRQG